MSKDDKLRDLANKWRDFANQLRLKKDSESDYRVK